MQIFKLSVVAGFVAACLVQSAPGLDWSGRMRYEPSQNSFDSQEMQLDLFGLWASRDRDDFSGDTLGLGAGFNYFFSRYVGIGAETYLDEVDIPNHLDFSVIGRYPIDQYSLAPYAFAGFGRQYHDVSQWTSHVGGGVEYRLNSNTGLFLDVRGIFADKSRDLSMWRFGVRLKF